MGAGKVQGYLYSWGGRSRGYCENLYSLLAQCGFSIDVVTTCDVFSVMSQSRLLRVAIVCSAFVFYPAFAADIADTDGNSVGDTHADANALNVIDVDAIAARLTTLMDDPSMVGLAVVIVEDGKIVHVKGYGETLAGTGDKVTTETVFRWASLSKGVASTLAAKLDEDGIMPLNAPVSQYVTSLDLPEDGEDRATIADVLSHRLGIVRNAYDNILERGKDPAEIRGRMSGLGIECPVGTCHAYQNVAFDSVAEMVKSSTGEEYSTASERQLFKPLGMTSVSLTLDGLLNAPRFARPHNRLGVNVYRKQRDHYYRVAAAGGVNSNIKDLGLWMQAQMGMMPDVVSIDVRARMHEPVVGTTREANKVRRYYPRMLDASYGLGWRIYDYDGHKVVGHRGAVNGYRAMIMFDPARKSGVAALWNSGSNQPVGLQLEVMDAVYGLPTQDWMYLKDGPDLKAIRAATLKAAEPINAPIPRLAPYVVADSFPADHGQPFYTLSACFGFRSPEL